ncbi:hypothetical protein MAPG_08784 [Magnaporthiopsis poae ATCC 64411]|uniref:Uncharacterized protein n=1 Tax=Magnaporthiopsis poae (strain ATCC 64411 / 73-15) TaxID=644358 RepID=A0A0C4E887_MAGP6|nr:hypothetical protein MAPG_08784 [Magnaporthiopsis poae ATCC 64411]
MSQPRPDYSREPRFTDAFEVDDVVAPWYKRPEYISRRGLAPFLTIDVLPSLPQASLLWLWAACVTQFQHKDLRWDACLSAGAQILQYFAKSQSAGEKFVLTQMSKWNAETEGKLVLLPSSSTPFPFYETKVMGFSVYIADPRDKVWHVDGHPAALDSWADGQPQGDEFASGYGPSFYAAELLVNYMLAALETWEGHEVELGRVAHDIYRSFRGPDGFEYQEVDWVASDKWYYMDMAYIYEAALWKGEAQ